MRLTAARNSPVIWRGDHWSSILKSAMYESISSRPSAMANSHMVYGQGDDGDDLSRLKMRPWAVAEIGQLDLLEGPPISRQIARN